MAQPNAKFANTPGGESEKSFRAIEKFLGIAKIVAQAQVVCGLMCVGLGTLYWATRGGTRDIGSGVWCGLYFMLTGIVGVIGAASRRQGPITAYVVMAGHAAALFAPVLVLVNSFGTYADGVGCYVGCRQRPHFNCELICDGSIPDHTTWTLPGFSARVIDLSLVTLGLLELCLCISGAITASRASADACGRQVSPASSAKQLNPSEDADNSKHARSKKFAQSGNFEDDTKPLFGSTSEIS